MTSDRWGSYLKIETLSSQGKTHLHAPSFDSKIGLGLGEIDRITFQDKNLQFSSISEDSGKKTFNKFNNQSASESDDEGEDGEKPNLNHLNSNNDLGLNLLEPSSD